MNGAFDRVDVLSMLNNTYRLSVFVKEHRKDTMMSVRYGQHRPGSPLLSKLIQQAGRRFLQSYKACFNGNFYEHFTSILHLEFPFSSIVYIFSSSAAVLKKKIITAGINNVSHCLFSEWNVLLSTVASLCSIERSRCCVTPYNLEMAAVTAIHRSWLIKSTTYEWQRFLSISFPIQHVIAITTAWVKMLTACISESFL